MSRTFLKPCVICGQLARQTRCEKHQQELNQAKEAKRDTPARRAKKKQLYGGDYPKRRALLLATATHCWICKQPFNTTDKIEADHIYPGNPDSPLAPAHRHCNQSRGDKPITKN